MAFKTGTAVKEVAFPIVGTIVDARMNAEAGEIEYLVEYPDAADEMQQRWFLENQLTEVN